MFGFSPEVMLWIIFAAANVCTFMMGKTILSKGNGTNS